MNSPRLLGALAAGFALILMRGALVGVMGPITCAFALWGLSRVIVQPRAKGQDTQSVPATTV